MMSCCHKSTPVYLFTCIHIDILICMCNFEGKKSTDVAWEQYSLTIPFQIRTYFLAYKRNQSIGFLMFYICSLRCVRKKFTMKWCVRRMTSYDPCMDCLLIVSDDILSPTHPDTPH